MYIYMLYMTIPRFLTFPNLFFRLPLAPCGSRGWPLPSSTSQTMKVWDWSTLTRPLSSWNFRWNHPLFSEEMNNNERAGRKQKKTIGSSIFLSHFSHSFQARGGVHRRESGHEPRGVGERVGKLNRSTFSTSFLGEAWYGNPPQT